MNNDYNNHSLCRVIKLIVKWSWTDWTFSFAMGVIGSLSTKKRSEPFNGFQGVFSESFNISYNDKLC